MHLKNNKTDCLKNDQILQKTTGHKIGDLSATELHGLVIHPDGGHGVGTMLTGAFLRLVQEIDAGALIGVITRMCRMFSSSKYL